MFAVIKTGGKQYKVSPGTLLKVERLEGEAGQSIHLPSVLLLNNEGTITVGTPLLDQVQVSATIVEQARADKIIVFKKKRRQGYRRKAGHRQDITVLRIEEILTAGKGHAHRKSHDAKVSPQPTEEPSKTATVSDTPLNVHASETAKLPVTKKPKVKKEAETPSASAHPTPKTTKATSTPTEPTMPEVTSVEPAKKPVKKTSSAVSKSKDEGKETSVIKEKKKPSSKSSHSDSSDSQ